MFGRSTDSDNSSHSTHGDPSSSSHRKESSGHNGAFEQKHDVSAFVGEGVEFKGTITYEGTVRIDGQLDGEIHTKGVLLVGQGAVITAKVEAGTVISQGRIVGDIIARDKIQLKAPAVVDGSVRTPSLSMEEGVLFNGSCEMGPVRESHYEGESRLSTYSDATIKVG